ncbi:MAG: polysaccharide deacetylase family protein [Anaerolineae bacterium]|nr:polysaccharide deacetylase family protein [Anaerolineae bacterium]
MNGSSVAPNQNLPSHALTIDLEEWFQGLTSTNRQGGRWPEWPARAAGLTDRLLELLAGHGVRATFFVVGALAAAEPALIARIAAAGHELAVHGYDHRFVHELTPAQFRAELRRTVHAIRRAAGDVPILGHRAPYFSINGSCLWALDVLADEGFVYDSSLIRTRNPLYGFAQAPLRPVRLQPGGAGALTEFPVTTIGLGRWRLPCGGFAWRVLPYPVIRALVRRAQAQGAIVAYVHPWEFDTNQPAPTRLTARERITHRAGRARLWSTWRRLLTDSPWGPLADHLALAERLPLWSLA